MRNKRIDLARRTRQANVLYDEIDDGRAAESDSFKPTRRAELMRNAMRRLSKEQREILGLAFFGAETHQHAAQRLAIPIATVDSGIGLTLECLRSATDVVRATEAQQSLRFRCTASTSAKTCRGRPEGLSVKRHPIGTLYRRRKGTPFGTSLRAALTAVEP